MISFKQVVHCLPFFKCWNEGWSYGYSLFYQSIYTQMAVDWPFDWPAYFCTSASNLMAIHVYIHPQGFNESNLKMMGTPKPGVSGSPFRGHSSGEPMWATSGVYICKWLAFSVGWCLSKSLPWNNGWVHITISIHPSILSWLALEFQVIHWNIAQLLPPCRSRLSDEGVGRWEDKNPQSLIWTSFFLETDNIW